MNQSVQAQKVQAGFKLNSIKMSDGENGELLWSSTDCSDFISSDGELKAHIPKKILKCRSVAREINFSSVG